MNDVDDDFDDDDFDDEEDSSGNRVQGERAKAAVEHIAGHHQVAVAPAPAALGVDHVVGAQQPHHQVVLAVHVRERDQAARTGDHRGGLGGGAWADPQFVGIAAARRPPARAGAGYHFGSSRRRALGRSGP